MENFKKEIPADCRCKNCRFYHKLRTLEKGRWAIEGCCTREAETMKSLGSDAMVVPALEDDFCDQYMRALDYK